jgi:RNA polymerase sigma factor (sigma-70 family)
MRTARIVEGPKAVASQHKSDTLRPLRLLWHVGSVAGLTDGQLLERFATHQREASELAFEALMERHGRMVLRTCRAILRNEHDSQDAFQATFLVLVRKARSLWVKDSLGPWLHRVACLVASRAKVATLQRAETERKAAEMTENRSRAIREHDLASILHSEIEQVPERYRTPLILCDLESRSYEEAARHLGCPVGTVKSRLARGRACLLERLTRRGFAPSAGMLGAALSENAASAGVPVSLMDATAKVASVVLAEGGGYAGLVPGHIASLVGLVSREIFMNKLKMVVGIPLVASVVGLSAVGVSVVSQSAVLAQEPTPDVEQRLSKLEGKVDQLLEKHQRVDAVDAPTKATRNSRRTAPKDIQQRLADLEAKVGRLLSEPEKPNRVDSFHRQSGLGDDDASRSPKRANHVEAIDVFSSKDARRPEKDLRSDSFDPKDRPRANKGQSSDPFDPKDRPRAQKDQSLDVFLSKDASEPKKDLSLDVFLSKDASQPKGDQSVDLVFSKDASQPKADVSVDMLLSKGASQPKTDQSVDLVFSKDASQPKGDVSVDLLLSKGASQPRGDQAVDLVFSKDATEPKKDLSVDLLLSKGASQPKGDQSVDLVFSKDATEPKKDLSVDLSLSKGASQPKGDQSVDLVFSKDATQSKTERSVDAPAPKAKPAEASGLGDWLRVLNRDGLKDYQVYIDQLAEGDRSGERIADALFRSHLHRDPTFAERAYLSKHFEGIRGKADRRKAIEDVLWAILNSKEHLESHRLNNRTR